MTGAGSKERAARYPSCVMRPAGQVVKMPARAMDLCEFVTPASDLFVVAHLGTAHVALADWTLAVEGLVETPLRLAREEVLAMPATEVTAVIECAGNPFRPTHPVRRAGNVVWRGVPIRSLLDRAGMRAGARYVWFEGQDSGTYGGAFTAAYVKDIPLDKAMAGDVLLAWAINGEPLTAEHGFPFRVIVPGYYGTNSVKWVSRITVSDRRPEGLFTTQLYYEQAAGCSEHRPVWELPPTSLIVSPADGARLSGLRHRVAGWAWGGTEIAGLEISDDGGRSWRAATVAPRKQWAWQRFVFEWKAAGPGVHTLTSRAADAKGETQPLDGARNRVHSIGVTVAV